jgi:hydroxymethylpyrimidine pyrophosphatase-like HAD family hydrolase/adenine/guanine phosphoribosyltransferase-like PRPP-binding protein
MSPGASRARVEPLGDQAFYSGYAWCLDPVPALRELLSRMEEELRRFRAPGAEWQREERRINLYLFACAIACTTDDHLARRPWRIGSVARRFPKARRAALAAAWLLNLPHTLRSRREDQRARAWRRRWTAVVDAACELLLGGEPRLAEMAREVLAEVSLSEAALARRMRIPEGYRCQDLAHFDVVAMTERAREDLPERGRPLLIVGPRTAGAYFAPLAAAHLRLQGYSEVQWVTVRPKHGLSPSERKTISESVGSGAAALIIDDHQNTGATLRLLLTELRALGAESRDIVVTIPAHPARPDWDLPEERARGVHLCLFPAAECHKARLLNSDWVSGVVTGAERTQSEETAALNRKIEAHASDGFQARVQRVFDVCGARPRRVVAKSVGWGWLGYHAWVAGSRLAGFVPRPLTLRDGMLVSEWVEGESLAERGSDQSQVAEAFADYAARRVRSLALDADPASDTPGYRWCGWDDLAEALGGVYGRPGRLKAPVIRRKLRRYVTPLPVLVDGSMKPADWVRAGDALYKTDFEQHNFGGGELDITDAAWDLAAAVFEFSLSEQAERRMLAAYVERTGDTGAAERLLPLKILYARTVMRSAVHWVGRSRDAEKRREYNRRFSAARDFAAFQMARYCGRALGLAPRAWTDHLFFLDLDGVFDWTFFGFPHTTPAGVEALRLLRAAGFSVVLNTARSVEHVREYCHAYRLPGGIAEMGSVFWDEVERQEVPLVDPQAAAQLQRVREELERLPDVLVDTANQWSVRAYRYRDGRTLPLAAGEAEAAMVRAEGAELTHISSSADTYFLQRGRGKGTALREIAAYLGCSDAPVAAMGDSDRDLDMLAAATAAYAPRNASAGVRELIRRGRCRRMKGRLQMGLLDAAQELSGETAAAGSAAASLSPIDRLLQVPDRRGVGRLAGLLRWNGL